MAIDIFEIYTDGGCARNPGGVGAYAVVRQNTETGEVEEFTGAYRSTTNNRMEIMAIIVACESLPKYAIATIYSDSLYVINTVEKRFQKKKNFDLWNRLEKAMYTKNLFFEWVKGHDGNFFNERCDTLCTQTMINGKREEDTGYQEAEPIPLPRQTNFQERKSTYTTPFLKKYPGGSLCIQIPEYPDIYSGEKLFVNPDCLRQIEMMNKTVKPSFGDYSKLRTGGKDGWSSYSNEQLSELIGERITTVINGFFDDSKNATACMKWFCRGLRLDMAIRKVFVDMEISANCGK